MEQQLNNLDPKVSSQCTENQMYFYNGQNQYFQHPYYYYPQYQSFQNYNYQPQAQVFEVPKQLVYENHDESKQETDEEQGQDSKNVSSTSSTNLKVAYDTPVISPPPTNDSTTSEQYSSPPITTSLDSMKNFYPTPPSEDSIRDKSYAHMRKSPDCVPSSSDIVDDVDDLLNQPRIKRRTRTQFSKNQIDMLEAIFTKNHYPDVQTVDRLAETLGLAIERISVWFQNRRAKYKKTKKTTSSGSKLSENKIDIRSDMLSNKPLLTKDVINYPITPNVAASNRFIGSTFDVNMMRNQVFNQTASYPSGNQYANFWPYFNGATRNDNILPNFTTNN